MAKTRPGKNKSQGLTKSKLFSRYSTFVLVSLLCIFFFSSGVVESWRIGCSLCVCVCMCLLCVYSSFQASGSFTQCLCFNCVFIRYIVYCIALFFFFRFSCDVVCDFLFIWTEKRFFFFYLCCPSSVFFLFFFLIKLPATTTTRLN